MYVGKKIKQLRHSLELTQEGMANALNVSRQHYLAIETGKKQISSKMLSNILENWGVNLEYANGDILETSQEKKGDIKGGDIGGIANRHEKGFSTKDMETFFQILSDSQYSGDSKTQFYYKHPVDKLELILSNTKDDLKEAYESYYRLIEVSAEFGAPDFMHYEKFLPSEKPFKEYLKAVNKEFKEENEHISDNHLYKSLLVIEYQERRESYLTRLFSLIKHMSTNYDLYSSIFEKHHSDLKPDKKAE